MQDGLTVRTSLSLTVKTSAKTPAIGKAAKARDAVMIVAFFINNSFFLEDPDLFVVFMFINICIHCTIA